MKLNVREDDRHVIFGADLSPTLRQAITDAARSLGLTLVPSDDGGFRVEVPDVETAEAFGRATAHCWRRDDETV